MKPVAGLVDSWRDAESALAMLHDAGFGEDRVSVIAGDPRKAFASAPERGLDVVAGTAGGAGIGGVVGGLMGWIADLVELGALEIEEIIVSGPVAALADVVDPMVIAGVGLGGVLGGLLGTHAGWSFAEDQAKTYSQGVARGRVMLVVRSIDVRDADRAVDILRQARAKHSHTGISDS